MLNNLTVGHDDVAVGDTRGEWHVLLGQNQAEPLLLEHIESAFEDIEDGRRQSLARLVEDQHVGVSSQGKADRQHLLLTARQHPGHRLIALFQEWE